MKHTDQEKQVSDDIERYGGSILHSEKMQQAFRQKHHLRSTVGDHTMRVARTSLKIGHTLQKLHVNVDIPAIVIGSLCHDLGILGRKNKYSSDKECYRKHPADSVSVAKELLDDLPEKSEDIIQSHMWPMYQSKAPCSIEGFIVSAADKYSSVVDLIKGSKRKHAHKTRSLRSKK